MQGLYAQMLSQKRMRSFKVSVADSHAIHANGSPPRETTMTPAYSNTSGEGPRTLTNKRVLITGANGGLGLATSAEVLREGASIVLACRSRTKAEAARTEALAASGAPADRAVAAGGFDMLDPASVEAAVAALPPNAFDVVFLQAGGWVWADEAQTVTLNGHRVERTVDWTRIGRMRN